MKEKNKKKILAIVFAVVALVVVGTTYAFITTRLSGTKKVTITAGTLSLVLNEGNAITISDALPMYDQVGMIQEKSFNFSLANNTSNDTDYTLKLVKIDSANELQTSIVKYYLTKEGVGEPALLSSLTDGVIDTGTIVGNDTIDYTLRLWIDSEVTDQTLISGKSLSYRIDVEAVQNSTLATEDSIIVDWSIGDNYLETVLITSNSYLIKLSDEIITKEKLIGTEIYLEMNEEATSCGDNCIYQGIVTQEMIDNNITIDEQTGTLIFNNILFFVPDASVLDGISVTQGVWVIASKNDDETYMPIINKLIIKNKTKTQKITFAGITKDVNEIVDTMFNYTSEGIDPLGGASVTATNGIYAIEDEDGPSYFYRGEVNNLVKFGSYTKDYYVYRYTSGSYTYDFSSLDACKYYNSSCSETNKVLKYKASDNVPMYWRIVRINGDGTIRMIYAGTSPDAKGQDTGIGLSRYNEEYNDPKYAGYTYDRTTSKTNSDAKTEIDNWYSNVFEGATYDNDIATGKFCSDSSGYEYDEVATQMFGSETYTYGGFRRNFANMFGRGNASPSFKCSNEMDENIGGSYSFKAGLITLDEIVAAGGQAASNNSYYLYNGTKGNDDGWYFWPMSPAAFSNGTSYVGSVNDDGSAFTNNVNSDTVLLRPVINLRSDISFKSGTDGSTTSPYEIE